VHEHAGTVTIGHLQVGAFLPPETTGVNGRQTGPRAPQCEVCQHGADFCGTENNRELLLSGCTHTGEGRPCPLARVCVAERETAEGNGARAACGVCDMLEGEKVVPACFCRDPGG
jgi:hypothetical protein